MRSAEPLKFMAYYSVREKKNSTEAVGANIRRVSNALEFIHFRMLSFTSRVSVRVCATARGQQNTHTHTHTIHKYSECIRIPLVRCPAIPGRVFVGFIPHFGWRKTKGDETDDTHTHARTQVGNTCGATRSNSHSRIDFHCA